MRKVLLLVLCCMTALFAWANDGAFYANGNHLIPITETDIRVQKEVLTLNRVGDIIQVTVYYEFYNPVGEKDVLVGFEAKEPSVYINELSIKMFPEHPYMRNFKVVMNGEPLTFEVAHVSHFDENGKYISNPQYFVDSKIQDGGLWIDAEDGDEGPVDHPLYVYHFNARFRPGLNIIQHTYDFDISFERNGFTSEFDYILTAANRWANHRIDDFTLYVDMGDHTSFHISPFFFNSAEEWEIQGTGKYTVGTLPYQLRQDSIFFHMQHGKLRFHKENFHPDGELRIDIDQPGGGLRSIWSLNNDDANNVDFLFDLYKEQYLRYLGPFYSGSFIDSDKKEFYNDLFTLEQRRILRNLPFAYRGYVFKTQELQEYYESTAWYIPNPEYKAQIEQLPEEEQKWVEFWSLSESFDNAKKKQIEDRVNSMYQHVFSEFLKPGHKVPRTNFDSIYYSKEFYHLHRMIGSIENQLGEPIIHDADYWVWGQDWCDDLFAKVLSIELVTGKKANVTVNIRNCRDKKVTLVMIYERDNWFIDDITEGVSTRQLILKYLEEYKKEGIEPSIK